MRKKNIGKRDIRKLVGLSLILSGIILWIAIGLFYGLFDAIISGGMVATTHDITIIIIGFFVRGLIWGGITLLLILLYNKKRNQVVLFMVAILIYWIFVNIFILNIVIWIILIILLKPLFPKRRKGKKKGKRKKRKKIKIIKRKKRT